MAWLFRKKNVHMKSVFWFSLQRLSETFLNSRRVPAATINLPRSLCKVPAYFFGTFIKFSLKILPFTKASKNGRFQFSLLRESLTYFCWSVYCYLPMWRHIIFALCTKWLHSNETAVGINGLTCIITSFPLSPFHWTEHCSQQNKEKKLTQVVLPTRILLGLDMSLHNYSHCIKSMCWPVRYTLENHVVFQ